MRKQDVQDPRFPDTPSDEIDPENPFVRKKEPVVRTRRACIKCGKSFDLHVEYDPENFTHDLCEDCILDDTSHPQDYSEKTNQLKQMSDNGVTYTEFTRINEVVSDD